MKNELARCDYEAAKASASYGGGNGLLGSGASKVRDLCMQQSGYHQKWGNRQSDSVANSVSKETPTSNQSPVKNQQTPITFTNVNYSKLGSAAFMSDYDGKGVSFITMFIGEWTIPLHYQNAGILT
jgi:hypothetical protein